MRRFRLSVWSGSGKRSHTKTLTATGHGLPTYNVPPMLKRFIPILISAMLLVGCGEEPKVQRYEVTKPAGFNWPTSELREDGVKVDRYEWVWDVPEGWIDAPEVPSQLLADYRFKGSNESLPGRATVSKIDGDAGGVNANVLRWLQQIYVTNVTGIGPDDKVDGPFNIGVGQITFVDLHGQYQGEHMPSRIYAVILQIPAEGGGVFQTWVFKLAGDHETVEANRAGMAQMAFSFRPKGAPRLDLPSFGERDEAADDTQESNDTP